MKYFDRRSFLRIGSFAAFGFSTQTNARKGWNMEASGRSFLLAGVATIWLMGSIFAGSANGQAVFTAQLRGTVQDSSNAVVPRADVTITNEGTGVAEKTVTNQAGRYIFNTLQPASYTVKVEAQGFTTVVRSNVVLRVDQQADLDFTMDVGNVSTAVEVTANAVLLNSTSAALGQEVTNRYVTEVPLLDRQIANLAYLTPGVTETTSTANNGVINTNFQSNGQRNTSAEERLDGAIISLPDAGEGADFRARFQPSIEIVQEFKFETNGLSAQYGSNGGTVINIVTKSGTNEFHGSGYWFLRRPELDANAFFSNRAGQPKQNYKKDQYGGAIGGPIRKQKSFFFFNYERGNYNAPVVYTTTTPTALQKQGNFSTTLNPNGTLQQIFNPFDTYTASDGSINRLPFAGNIIPASLQDPIAMKLMDYYPDPTGPGTNKAGLNNYTASLVNREPNYQYNVKIDYIFSDKSRLSGRYGLGYQQWNPPLDQFLGAVSGTSTGGVETDHENNAVITHTWTLTPTTVWINQISGERVSRTKVSQNVDPAIVGFPPILEQISGKPIMPRIDVAGFSSLGVTGAVNTLEGGTEWVPSSLLYKVVGSHNLSFGGEQRTWLNNFWQPQYPAGHFAFSSAQTTGSVFSPSSSQGNGLASLLVGWGDPSNTTDSLAVTTGTAQKSKETSFFVQDDWKVTPYLTLNLGLRYEWSDPYTDRFNRLQIANFTADTGVNVPGLGELHGVAEFATPNRRTVAADRNNLAPRLGLAYRLGQKTVVRAGAGIYYGVNYATNYQSLGAAFRTNVYWLPTLDGGVTRNATLENPFSAGTNFQPQGTTYGVRNQWGLKSDFNDSEGLNNADIYQWNVTVQRELARSILLEIAYSANRSTHLPIGGSRNQDIISQADREEYGSAGLAALVPNPFQPLFAGPNASFQVPNSQYNKATIPRINLLRPYPQFDGEFDGFVSFAGSSMYNSLQMKFERRYSNGLNLVGSYTVAKSTDNSSYTANSGFGDSAAIQDLTNLRGEYSVSAFDIRQRATLGGSYELPIGRGRRLGGNMSRGLSAIAGNWQVNGYLTLQTALPLNVTMNLPRLADGNQRPNISGSPRSGASIGAVVSGAQYFNLSAFSDPGDQMAGNAPRYSDVVRGDGIRNIDLSIFKNLKFRESMNLQLRAEFFNFANTPRFAPPNTAFGSGAFGTISAQLNNPRQSQMGVRFLF